MATTLPGGSGTDVILPEGVSPDLVEVGVGADGGTIVAIKKKVSGLAIEAAGDTAVTGKRVSDSEVNVKSKKGETANIVFQTTVVEDTTITNEGKGALKVNLNTGKVKNLTIDSGNKKRDDIVRVKDDVKLIKSTMDMGKGDDTVRFGEGVTFKGTSTVDLGKGGKDAIVIEADGLKSGKLIVTSFTKKDTITVGDETFTMKDIKNGAEIPGVKVELA